MKNKLVSVMFVLCLMSSVALGQTNTATEVVTDDATMARLRVAYIVINGPNVDVLINGEIAMNPGQPQANIPCCQVTGYVYLTPGTYSVAVVPTGQAIEEAILGPLDVAVDAGHRYTIATIGQLEDTSRTPLIIDETVVVQEVRTSPEQTIMIQVNNLAGPETLSITYGGQGPQDPPYGGFAAAPIPFGPHRSMEFSADGEVFDTILCDASCDTAIPGVNALDLRFGRFPSNYGEDYGDAEGVGVSDLNALEFMRGFSGLGVQRGGQILSFDTFLAAVETAGLSEMLATGGPYLMFVPIDEAFANLPEGQLNALMADPEALADWLRYHITEGYYPPGSLSGTSYGTVDRTLTNMMGADLKLLRNGDTFTINGITLNSFGRYQVPNGSFVLPMSTVLLPPEQ
ncbi:MAG: fasciclin domain-containing protein [Deinococcota bacterium]|nr:fasciclin domain-containing protein [Deinococcota bacterium]